jgi:hypothetical protein
MILRRLDNIIYTDIIIANKLFTIILYLLFKTKLKLLILSYLNDIEFISCTYLGEKPFA